MSKVLIYALCCPITGDVRYVGRTVNSLQRRLREHIGISLRGKMKHKQKEDWIRILKHAGTSPKIVLLEEAHAANFKEREKHWIAQCSTSGWILNARAGGDGGLGGHRFTWTAELDAMLGVEPDAVVAEMLGCTRKTVAYRRERLGKSASFNRRRNSKPPPAKPVLQDSLMSMDGVVSRLGNEPDHSIASSVGVSRRTVSRLRNRLGIKPFADTHGKSGRFGDGRKKENTLSDDDSRLVILGTMPDKQAATVLGVKHGVVCRMRNRLGIATYRSTRKKS